MKVLIVTTQNGGVEYHRLTQPHSWLNKFKGVDISSINLVELMSVDFFKQFEIVVFSRFISRLSFDYINSISKKIKSAGAKIIVDVDDYWNYNGRHAYYAEHIKQRIPEFAIRSLCAADYVITTHNVLANYVRKFNKNICVIPNALNHNDPQFFPYKKNNERKVIGWAGSHCHIEDIEEIGIACALLKSDNDFKIGWKITQGGYDGSKHSVAIGTVLTANQTMDRDKYSYIPVMPVSEYGNTYNSFDIGLIPLADNTFNRCKSNLKMLEMGLKEIPVIVSGIHPYTSIASNEENCLVVSKKKQWFKAIKRMMNDDDLRERLGKQLRKDVIENYSLDKWGDYRYEFYKSII